MIPSESSTQRDQLVSGRYRLLRRLGEDGSTQTWEAQDTRLERRVSLRLLADDAREDPSAEARLRAAAREPRLASEPDAPRVLDGGHDPVRGPFIVAELGRDLATTQRLSVVAPPPSADGPRSAAPAPRPARVFGHSPTPAASEHAVRVAPGRDLASPRRGGSGVLVLGALLVVVLVALVFLARSFVSSEQQAAAPATAPTAEQTTRPVSGAPAATPAAKPTLAPTPAAPGQARVQPTTQAAAQPTSAPTRQPTAQPTPPPAAPGQAAGTAGSPVDTIRQHYALINARNYAAGYALMDTHLRSLNSPADYAGWFANKVSIEPISVDLVSQKDGQAVVRSVVRTTDRVNGKDVTTQVSEQFVLRNEDGAWRIDEVARV